MSVMDMHMDQRVHVSEHGLSSLTAIGQQCVLRKSRVPHQRNRLWERNCWIDETFGVMNGAGKMSSNGRNEFALIT